METEVVVEIPVEHDTEGVYYADFTGLDAALAGIVENLAAAEESHAAA